MVVFCGKQWSYFCGKQWLNFAVNNDCISRQTMVVHYGKQWLYFCDKQWSYFCGKQWLYFETNNGCISRQTMVVLNGSPEEGTFSRRRTDHQRHSSQPSEVPRSHPEAAYRWPAASTDNPLRPATGCSNIQHHINNTGAS